MAFITSVALDITLSRKRVKPCFAVLKATPFPRTWDFHHLNSDSKDTSTTFAELTGPAGRPTSPFIQSNNDTFPINQKLQTDFSVS